MRRLHYVLYPPLRLFGAGRRALGTALGLVLGAPRLFCRQSAGLRLGRGVRGDGEIAQEKRMHTSSPARHLPSPSAGLARSLLLAGRWRRLALASAAACPVLLPAAVAAYTAAGDRIFPATLLLPQAAPTDALYVTPSSQPAPGGTATDFTASLDN